MQDFNKMLAEWVIPDVSPDDASDEQLRETPFYKALESTGMLATMSQDKVFSIVRTSWKDNAAQLEQKAYADEADALFAKAVARSLVPETGEARIYVDRKADGSLVVKARKSGGAGGGKRLKDEDIAKLIGLGEPDDEKAKLCQEGGFIYARKGGSVNAGGVWELVFEAGDPENKLCPEYTAKLYTRIEGESHPTYVYPPASGDKGNLAEPTDDIVEVPNWTTMGKESPLNSPFSPLKLFDIAKHIKSLSEGDDAPEGNQPEASDDVDIDDLPLDEDED